MSGTIGFWDGTTRQTVTNIAGRRLPVEAGDLAARCVIPDVPLPPGLWKAVVKNVSGVTYAASGNSLKCRPHNLLST